MVDSKLPTVGKKNLAKPYQTSRIEALKGMRTHRFLLAAGVATSAGALGIFLVSQQIVFSVILAAAGVLFFSSRQLIKKSLTLTSTHSQLQLTSTDQQLEQMRKQVSKCKFLENVETEGSRVASQADQLVHQFKNLKNILSQKFEPSEITFSRYLDSIESSCLSISENLTHTKTLLDNLNLTNKELSPETRDQVKQLLDSTDQALHGLSELFNSINKITTKERHRDQLEQSMQQIRELAERAKIYSKN